MTDFQFENLLGYISAATACLAFALGYLGGHAR